VVWEEALAVVLAGVEAEVEALAEDFGGKNFSRKEVKEMPAGDGTGPLGLGPMTGRGMGYCAGYGVPGFANPWPRWGFGWGRGRGWRWWYWATGLPGWARFGFYRGVAPWLSAEDELAFLKNQARLLEQQLKTISQRIEELEKAGGAK